MAGERNAKLIIIKVLWEKKTTSNNDTK